MGLSVERVEILLLIAAVVSMLARRVKLPYTIGLVAAGLGVALLHLPFEVTLTKSLIFTAFLPPLIFQAAFQMPWKELKRDMLVTTTLATLGVLVSAAVVSAAIFYVLHWPWQAAMLMGVLISATDPVSVLATFKAAGVHGRLAMLVEAESLFNDGTAAVLFTVALTAISAGTNAAAASSTPPVAVFSIMLSFCATVFGGIVCGAITAGIALLLSGRTDDHLIEITFTTVAAYGSFLVADRFHMSGVLATMTAGVILGNIGPLGALSHSCRDAVTSFWDYLCFVANSLIFLLIGMPLAHQSFSTVWAATLAVIAFVIVGRALSVYGCCGLFSRSQSLKVSLPHQHILFWGGLRGALALALVLGLPETMPLREPITTVAFGVVIFSIVVQGLTVTPLLRRLGVIDAPQALTGESAAHAGDVRAPNANSDSS